MYMWEGGEPVWTEPEDENLHVEIAVLDASDERFVPCLKVTGTLIDPDGNEVGTHDTRCSGTRRRAPRYGPPPRRAASAARTTPRTARCPERADAGRLREGEAEQEGAGGDGPGDGHGHEYRCGRAGF